MFLLTKYQYYIYIFSPFPPLHFGVAFSVLAFSVVPLRQQATGWTTIKRVVEAICCTSQRSHTHNDRRLLVHVRLCNSLHVIYAFDSNSMTNSSITVFKACANSNTNRHVQAYSNSTSFTALSVIRRQLSDGGVVTSNLPGGGARPPGSLLEPPLNSNDH